LACLNVLFKPCFQPNNSDNAYADEPAITGIANNPVPIIPSAKIVCAISPALGNVFTRGCSAYLVLGAKENILMLRLSESDT
jgi:hypothetical protein